MSSSSRGRSREIRERKNRNIKLIIICLILFFIGYYILNYVATMEKPPLGESFNIILGCVLIAISSIIIFLTVKKQFFPKKRRVRTKHVYLKDHQKINQD